MLGVTILILAMAACAAPTPQLPSMEEITFQ
jgi:hypothetical protein